MNERRSQQSKPVLQITLNYLMNILPTFSRTILIAAITLVATAPASHAQVNINSGYETGIFSGGISFAGGQAQDLNAGHEGVSPTFHALPFSPWLAGWDQANLGHAYWVESTAAFDGNHYLYLSGKDVCYNLTYGDSWGTTAHVGNLVIGQTYQFCVYAAAANATDQTLRFEWNSNGGSSQVTSFTIVGNSAWSDTSLTAIPWQQYCYTFTADSVDGVLTFSTDASVGSALVLDGATLAAVPEPGSALLVAMCGALGLMMRRRRIIRHA